MNTNIVDRDGNIIRYICEGYHLGEHKVYYLGESLEAITKEIFDPEGEHTTEEIAEMKSAAERYVKNHLPEGIFWDGFNELIIEATALDEQDDGEITWEAKSNGESVDTLWHRITDGAIREARKV